MAIYRSKISVGIVAPVILITGALLVVSLIESDWIVFLIGLAITLFVIHLFFTTYYLVDGSILKINANYTFFEDKMVIKSAMDMFTAYDDSFGNIDVNWDLLIGYNLTKLLTLTCQSTLKYDDDIKTFHDDGSTGSAKIQFKEMIGIGLSYKF